MPRLKDNEFLLCSGCDGETEHEDNCPVQNKIDRELGEALGRALLVSYDPAEVGRIIRKAIAEYS